MRQLPLLAVVSLAALGGCAVGPNYKPPAPPAGAGAPLIAVNPAATTTGTAPDDWWQLYDDPELTALIGQAFAANADLQVAEDNLTAARALYERASTRALPQTTLSAAGAYGRNPIENEILELTRRKPKTGWQYDAVLDVSYELDLFGHVRRTIEQARDHAQAVEAARDELRVTIAAETARAYGEICTLGEQITVANAALALAQQQQLIVQNQFDAGAASTYDVVRTQVVVTQAQAALPPLQGQREAALYVLTALLGETPQNAPVAVLSCVTPPHLAAPVPVGDGTALLQRRPDIREADRKYATALAAVGVSTADLFPRITLSGFYGAATNQINMLTSNNALTWGVGPAISWSFPNMQGPLARLSQSNANAQGALAGFNSVVLQALKETDQAMALYGTELQHHAALVTAQGEAQHEYSLAQSEYAAGGISALDLLASEQTLTNANAAVASADAVLVQDQISLFKALGGGWQSVPSPGQPGRKRGTIGGG